MNMRLGCFAFFLLSSQAHAFIIGGMAGGDWVASQDSAELLEAAVNPPDPREVQELDRSDDDVLAATEDTEVEY